MLTVCTPNQLKLFGEMMLKVGGYLAAPGIITSYLEGLKQVEQNGRDVVFFRSEKYGFLAGHGSQDDGVALFEVVIDVSGGLECGDVFWKFLGLAKQSAHSTNYVMIIASIQQISDYIR